MNSQNIFDNVHFLNGKDKYLRCDDELIYPNNKWILDHFNQNDNFIEDFDIIEVVEKINQNPKDWILVKHIIYDRDDENDCQVYGQIAICSEILGLKCYEYSYFDDDEDYWFISFEEISNKKFKFKSAVRNFINPES